MLVTMAPAPRKPRLLLVDDDRALLRVMIDMLIMYDLRIVGFAYDGTGVLDAIADATARYGGVDCVVMDEKMPHMSGIEATRKLREQYPKLPVVLHSAYAGTLGDAPRNAGVNAEVEKGGNPRALINAVRAVVDA